MKSLLKNIDDNIAFYESVSFSTFDKIDTIYFPANVASVIFLAIENRLRTLRFAVENTFVSDAYVLIRMIYEDIFTFIYLEVKKSDKLEDDDIKQWIRGKKKLHSLRMPDLLQFLTKTSPEIKECLDLLDVPHKYKDIKKNCNDFVHNNSFANLLLNTSGAHIKAKETHYERMTAYLEALKSLLFASLCILKPYYAGSSDYIDHLELGLSPPEGSQHWVAPFMQEEFNRLLKSNKKLAELIAKSSYMEFEIEAKEKAST